MPGPNILFIMTDQFRHDALGCVNGWTRTPNLDRLAARGTLFSQMVTNSLECIPARFALATGLYPHQTGLWDNTPSTLDPGFANWMQAIEAAGYATSLFGKTHLHRSKGDLRDDIGLMHEYGLQVVSETTGPPGNARVLSDMTEAWQARGVWDAFKKDMEWRRGHEGHYHPRPSTLPLDLYYDVYVPQRAKRHLESLGKEKPWFCWVSFGGPHPPYDTPEPYASLYKPKDIPDPLPRMKNADDTRGLLKKIFHTRRGSPDLSPAEMRAARADYAGAITLIDEQIGELLAAVEARGETGNTLVVFTSDHGEMDGDHGTFGKSNGLDGALRVPLIVAPPGGASGKRSEALVELMDVGATLVDYVGEARPKMSNARSLKPVLDGKADVHRGFAVSEFEEHHILVTPRWKAEFNKRGKTTLLIDRVNDPQEQEDLSRDRERRPAAAALARMLEKFLSETPPYDGALLGRAGRAA
jgi:arylsulfatase A-like enzyme